MNAVLTREMRGRWRRAPAFLILFGYTYLLSGVMLLVYARGAAAANTPGETNGAEILGQQLFGGFLMAQSAVWMVLSAALTATSVAGERERGLLANLLLSPLTSGAIVRGKLMSALGFIFLLLLVPMPVLSVCFSLGGLAPEEFLLAFLLLGSTAFSGACLGLAVSACHRRSDAALMTSLVISLTLCWPPVFAALIFNRDHFTIAALLTVSYQAILSIAALGVAADALNNLLPEKEVETSFFASHHQTAPPLPEGITPLPAIMPPSTPIARSGGRNEPRWTRLVRFENPVLQREVLTRLRRRVDYTSGESGTTLQTPQAGFFDYLFIAAGVSFFSGVILLTTGYGALLAALWVLFAALMAATLGALSFVREREAGTLQQLLLSLLSPREILWGKIGASCLLATGIAVPFVPLILVALWGRPAHAFAALTAASGAVFCASVIGLTCSWFARHSSVAVAASLAVVFALALIGWKAMPWWAMSNVIGAGAIATLLFWLLGTALLAFLARRLRPGTLERDRKQQKPSWN
jgi:ABC-type transport system involved in multi-copper enzyme maturation permease subunit